MLRPETKAALADISLETPWSLIERFSTLKREHPDDVAVAATEIVSRLKALGVPVSVHEPDLFLSIPGKASVSVGGQTFRAKPMAMSRPAKGLTAPLLYLPNATDPSLEEMFARPSATELDDQVAGRIVVTEGFGMPGKVSRFEALGALGMIAVNPGANPHWGICTSIWGTPDLYDLPRKPKCTVVAVNNPDGRAIIEAAKRGALATLDAALEEGWYRSPVPVVTIPGTEEPESFVLLHGHYDSWDVGVGDNAVGDATMLEIARVLWNHRGALKRSIRIAWWPGHSTGRYAGSTWFADAFAQDLYEHCIAQVNCDSPGCRWATEYLDISWFPEAEDFAKGIIKKVAGKEAEGGRPYQAGDYSFNNIGLSGYFMLLSTMSPSDREAKGYYAVGGCGGNIAWHTEDDTMAIADKNVLLTDMKIYLAAVAEAANGTVAPFDFRRTVTDFEMTLNRYQEAAGTAFSFDASRAALARLESALQRFAVHAAGLERGGDATDPPVRRANHAIRRLARILVPLNFTTKQAFYHDEAETIPPLPDLAPALELRTATPGQRGFILTHLTRGQNRLVVGLNAAHEVVVQAMT
ncbi:MAG: M28 family peptidase [Gemmatimonadota bacterium]